MLEDCTPKKIFKAVARLPEGSSLITIQPSNQSSSRNVLPSPSESKTFPEMYEFCNEDVKNHSDIHNFENPMMTRPEQYELNVVKSTMVQEDIVKHTNMRKVRRKNSYVSFHSFLIFLNIFLFLGIISTFLLIVFIELSFRHPKRFPTPSLFSRDLHAMSWTIFEDFVAMTSNALHQVTMFCHSLSQEITPQSIWDTFGTYYKGFIDLVRGNNNI
jgi:hypothetical protein